MGAMVPEHDAIALAPLLEKVYRDGGHDFREYKRGTVMRHLERRLHATGTRTYRAYMKFLLMFIPKSIKGLPPTLPSASNLWRWKGSIWAESELGRGTTFTFTLPKNRVTSL